MNLVLQPQGMPADLSQDHPELPLSARTKDTFTPHGWHTIWDICADLNKDGLPDLVCVIARQDDDIGKAEVPFNGNVPPRCLLIAFGKRHGGYSKSIENWDIIPCAGAGGIGQGEAFRGIKLDKQGTIVIETYAGSADRSGSTLKFRYMQHDWKLVRRLDSYDRSPDCYGWDLDRNLLTNYTAYSVWGKQNDRKSHYYILRACPAGNRKYLLWNTPHIRLNEQHSVVIGKELWKGPRDLSAKLSACFSETLLYIRAEVIDDDVTNKDGIHLLDSRFNEIKPKTSTKIKASHGYIQECTYALSNLDLPYNKDFPIRKNRPEQSAFATIEISDFDVETAHSVMSTSDSGRRSSAQVTLTPIRGLIRLADWNEDIAKPHLEVPNLH